MLLYDQVVAHGCRMRKKVGDARFGSHNLNRLARLRKAPAYEISSVAEILDDWGKARDQDIPKKPPHDNLWVEWRHKVVDPAEAGGTRWNWTVGCAIDRREPAEMTALLDSMGVDAPAENPAIGMELELWKSTAEETYQSVTFRRLDSVSGPKESLAEVFGGLGSISVDLDICLWFFRDGCRYVRDFKISCVSREFRASGDFTLPENHSPLFLPVIISREEGDYDPIFRPWPAFMAFMLLHCKNVTSELVPSDAELNRRLDRMGQPHRKTYRVLRLEVPTTANREEALASTAEGGSPKVRFHLCRGHFKNLQHERYRSKGWHWWPAHWKGSRSLGRVDKHYELHDAEEG